MDNQRGIYLEQDCLGSKITVTLQFAGDDAVVTVTGGEAPHVGSVSIGLPRASLSGDNHVSSTVSTFNLLGHMDDIIGDEYARKLAALLGKTVVVACGIHFDGLDHTGVTTVKQVAEELYAGIEAKLLQL